jgi:hypothetical protein
VAVLFGQPEIQVAAPKQMNSQDNHAHSCGLLHKVSKSNGDFALIDKHHRGSHTTPHTSSTSLTISSHLISSTPRTAPKRSPQNPSKSNQGSWSPSGAPGVDQEEEQGCQEGGAR